MIERVRTALAGRVVRSCLAARRPRDLPPIGQRRVLLVLPDDEPGQRATWDLVGRLDVPPGQVGPVVVGESIGYAPDAFAGAVRLVSPDERDWRGLPKAPVRRDVWLEGPDVALNLAEPGDLAAALLVGASPAAVRVGRHRPDREAFYDLMVQGAGSSVEAVEALGRLLRQLDPPVLPFR